jgi:pyridoxal phosphate enzyme (YggS family)
VADCVPVVLVGSTPRRETVTAVVHAGRKGVEGNIAGRTVDELRRRGAESISAWIGPSVCGRCYEVPEDMRAAVARVAPLTSSTTRWGTPALDLPAGVRGQLESAGVGVREPGGDGTSAPLRMNVCFLIVPLVRAGPWDVWRDLCGGIMTDASGRRSELEANLRRVNDRIDDAMAACGRSDRPTLIVVTKFFPPSDVAFLSGLGVRDVGENRDQEAAAKAGQVSDPQMRWHFIGQLQTNKARSVVGYAHSVHSVDRIPLVSALEKSMARRAEHSGSAGQGATGVHTALLDCYVQVNLSLADGSGRGGAAPSDVLEVAASIDDAGHLRLAGVMAVAPLGEDPRAAFSRLADISADVVARYPEATGISAGMSGDLEQAIAAGATHLRVGSDVLGARPPVG